MSNLPLIALAIAAAVGFSSAFFYGLNRRQELPGKVIAVASAVLMLGLMAYVAFVLIVVVSGKAGNPF